MFQVVSANLNIDFIGKRFIWLTVSAIGIIGSLTLLTTKGLNFGIDFTGGAVIQVQFKEAKQTGEVRKLMEQNGITFSIIQRVGEESDNEFQFKLKGVASGLQELSDRVSAALTTAVGADGFEVRKVDVVGPQAGKELRTKSYWAAFYALICILIYIAFRFDFRYSPGAIAALMHDAILTMGAFVVLQSEFSLYIVAALLTIIGYSINDTIIIYDRIRETIKANPKKNVEENINASINATMGRTVITSLTTLLAIVSLWTFGGGIIQDLAKALFIGVVIGTYSSIFIASPMFLLFAKYSAAQELKRKTA